MNLSDAYDNWVTRLGMWHIGAGVTLRNRDLLNDFTGWSWMRHYIFAVTGKEITEKQAQLLEKIWSLCGSYPDPRIWPNTVASICGTVRSTGALAVAAATAVAEAQRYGRGADIQAANFLVSIKTSLDGGIPLEKLVLNAIKNRSLRGFGRPIRKDGDERIEPMMTFAEQHGFAQGEYIRLIFDIESVIQQSRFRHLYMNIAIVVAALALDVGLSPRDYYYYTLLSYTAGVLPCFVDALEHPPGAFLPLRCEDINCLAPPEISSWID